VESVSRPNLVSRPTAVSLQRGTWRSRVLSTSGMFERDTGLRRSAATPARYSVFDITLTAPGLQLRAAIRWFACGMRSRSSRSYRSSDTRDTSGRFVGVAMDHAWCPVPEIRPCGSGTRHDQQVEPPHIHRRSDIGGSPVLSAARRCSRILSDCQFCRLEKNSQAMSVFVCNWMNFCHGVSPAWPRHVVEGMMPASVRMLCIEHRPTPSRNSRSSPRMRLYRPHNLPLQVKRYARIINKMDEALVALRREVLLGVGCGCRTWMSIRSATEWVKPTSRPQNLGFRPQKVQLVSSRPEWFRSPLFSIGCGSGCG